MPFCGVKQAPADFMRRPTHGSFGTPIVGPEPICEHVFAEWPCKIAISQDDPGSCSYFNYQLLFLRPRFHALRADLCFPAGQQATGRFPRQLLASRYSGGVLISSLPVVRARNEPLRPAGA